MVNLTGKNLTLGNYFSISVEWVSALGTLLAVVAALYLAWSAASRERKAACKVNKLLIQFYCYELNSANQKIVNVLIFVKAIRESFLKKSVSRGLVEGLVNNLNLTIQCYGMHKISENIDKYFQITDKGVPQNIIAQMKIMEIEAVSLTICKKEFDEGLRNENQSYFKINAERLDRIDKICRESFESNIRAFRAVKMEGLIIKIPPSKLQDLNLKYENN